ncbi:MAG: CheR family methyltransferase [Rhodospirillaceae bacterium]
MNVAAPSTVTSSEGALDAPKLGQRDFDTLAQLIESHAGIRMPPTKRTMVEGRLRRRLRQHGMTSYAEYCRFLFKDGGLDEELSHLIDAITTNKTEFFREPKHFDFLVSHTLPDMLSRNIGTHRPMNFWSAGSSIGAEAYTLAMILSDQQVVYPDFRFHILGTDVCTTVLQTARKAIYPEEMAEPIPHDMRRRYLMRSRNRQAATIRMAPEVRVLTDFRQLNFMDEAYKLRERQDVVFCRNVIIYFDNVVRTAVLSRICECIAPGGYLFMGHSETITGIRLPLRQVAPTVHIRT